MSRNIDLSIGEYYHIYNRGTDKRKIFLDASDYKRFQFLLLVCNSSKTIHASDYNNHSLVEKFRVPVADTLVEIGAYCLMPNHFHLLLKEKIENGTSLFMQKLLTGFTMYFNKKNHRTGSLFEGSFRAKHAEDDEYLKYLFAYVHLNPIGIIDSGWKEKKIHNLLKAENYVENYAYSSYRDYAFEKRPESAILTKSAFPEYFEGSIDFKNMMKEWMTFSDE